MFLPSSQKFWDDRVSNPNLKREKGTNSPNEKPTCAQCGKFHPCEFLVGMMDCFCCGKNGHKMRYFRNLKGQEKGGQAQASGSNESP